MSTLVHKNKGVSPVLTLYAAVRLTALHIILTLIIILTFCLLNWKLAHLVKPTLWNIHSDYGFSMRFLFLS